MLHTIPETKKSDPPRPPDPLQDLRHDLRNHLSAIRVAAHYLAKQAARSGFVATDPRIATFFAMIDAEVLACDRKLAKPGQEEEP